MTGPNRGTRKSELALKGKRNKATPRQLKAIRRIYGPSVQESGA